jgi:autotransporter-associated beta strand protein
MHQSEKQACAARVSIALAVLSAVPALGQSFNVITPISPTGAGYVSSTNTTTTNFTTANTEGDAVGYVTGYSGSTSLGNRYFQYDAAAKTTTLVGFYGGSYQSSTGSSSSSVNSVYGLDAVGDVVGYSSYYTGGTSAVAQYAWIYSPSLGTTTRIGLIDPTLGYTLPNGYSDAAVYGSSTSGAATGVSQRYNGSETSYFSGKLGADDWYYNPTTQTTTNIDPSGAQYTSSAGVRSNSMSLSGGAIDNLNFVYGSSAVETGGSGSDLWVYNAGSGVTTVITALQAAATATTPGYVSTAGTRSNTLGRINNNGLAVGTASVYIGTAFEGQQAFVYNAKDGTFRALGLPGSAYTNSNLGFGSSAFVATLINDNNDIVGTSNFYNSSGGTLGHDTFVYNYTTQAYHNVGPTTANFTSSTGARSSTATFLSGVGDVAGTATYYPSGTALGNRAFYYNAASQTTNIVGLTGTDDGGGIPIPYADNTGAETSAISAINANGLVAGYTDRGGGQMFGNGGFTPLFGQDAWVYDAATATTYKLQGQVSNEGIASSTVTAISNSNIVVGYYSDYNSNSVATGTTAFAWTLSTGMVDLGTLVTPNLGTLGWQSLAKALYVGPSGQIYATGQPSSLASGSTVLAMLSNVTLAANLTWNDTGGSPADGVSWDVNTNQNFNNGSGASVFHNGDNVTFDDTTPNNQYSVNIVGTVSPGSTTFNNSIGNYSAGSNNSGGIAGTGSLTKFGTGSVTLSSTNTYTGGTNVNNGTLVLVGTGAFPGGTNLSIGSVSTSASVVFQNHSGGTETALVVNSLSLAGTTGAWTGLLDLTDNALIVHAGSLATITNQIKQGYNSAIGGNWQGSGGITSSTAAADSTHLTALGVITNDNGSGQPLYGSGGTIASTFAGATPVDGDTLVKFTYYGDANLDGTVNGADYTRIDNGSSLGLTGWANGDFNYDGVINGSDYTLIDNVFNTQGTTLSSELASPSAVATAEISGSPVPEPSTGLLLGLAAGGRLLRRRPRNCRALARR